MENQEGPQRSPRPHAHIEVVEDSRASRPQGEPSPGLRNSKGWDGKLRVEKAPRLENPEALSDPEYSNEEHILKGAEIDADEGG